MGIYRKLADKIKKSRSLNELAKLAKIVNNLADKHVAAIDSLQESISSSTDDSAIRMRSRIYISTNGIRLDRDEDLTALPVESPVAKRALKNFQRPDMAELVAKFQPIQEVYHTLSVLELAEAVSANQISPLSRRDLSSVGKRLTNELSEARRKLELAIQEGLRALNQIARKNHPPEMMNLTTKIEGILREVLDEDSYTDLSSHFYVTPDRDPSVLKIYYTYYIHIEGHEDAMGYELPAFNVVVTGMLEGGYEEDIANKRMKKVKPKKDSAGKISYFITTVDEFRAPGSFDVGDPINDTGKAALRKTIASFVSVSDLMSKLQRYPLDISEEEIQAFGLRKVKGVEDIKSKNDALYVTIKKGLNPTDQYHLIQSVLYKVKPAIDTITEQQRKANSSVRLKYLNRDGKTVIKFIMAKDSSGKSGNSINAEILREIIERHGLNDEQARALRRNIQRM